MLPQYWEERKRDTRTKAHGPLSSWDKMPSVLARTEFAFNCYWDTIGRCRGLACHSCRCGGEMR